MTDNTYDDKNQEIQRKADELNLMLAKYKNNLDLLEKELLQIITDYHDALKEEKLKEIKARVKSKLLRKLYTIKCEIVK